MISTRTSHSVGLYNPQNEHDACGVGMVVNINGSKSHDLVDNALKVLENMSHRGAEGADGKTGDGAGIMLQIPHEFILLQGIPVPEKGTYGTGMMFLPKDAARQQEILSVVIEEIEREGLELMHMRSVPTDSSCLGEQALSAEPAIKQIFVTGFTPENKDKCNLILYKIRKRIERRVLDRDFYIPSLSSTIIVYKGMLSSMQLRKYFGDLQNPYFTSAIALVHSRFSTNTFPTWGLAQPFRIVAHNGEINTIRGNRLWMKARHSVLSSPAIGDLRELGPICQEGMSDSASFDNVLEFFIMSGLSLPQAMSIMIPESFNDKNPISDQLKAYYEYHSIMMEPWDGPAAMLFSDGRYAGGMLDRNGLRPSRYLITKNKMMVVASEAGVMDFPAEEIESKGRLKPGKMLIVDTQENRVYYDAEIKNILANAHPYDQWLKANRVQLENLKSGRKVSNSVPNLASKLCTFGFGREDIEKTIIPMCINGTEPTASMGNDTPLAIASDKPQIFFNYFRQQFAQVTNPAIDPIREHLVMSLTEYIGAVGSGILTPDPSNCKMVRLPHPILTTTQLDILCNIRYKGFNTVKLPMVFDISKGEDGLREALDKLCHEAECSVDNGISYIILSDRDIDDEHAAIPSLLATSAVHHHLINAGKRVQTAIIIESGEIREVMHAALLLGYGASAICPYLTFAVLDDLVRRGEVQENYETAEKNYIQAVCKGLLKILSKMGISTIRSYRGAMIFESIGLSEGLLSKYFGTPISTIGGIGLREIAADAISLHKQGLAVKDCLPDDAVDMLHDNGQFNYRRDGMPHAWNPETISTLQIATRLSSYKKFKDFTRLADEKEHPIFIRDFLDLKAAKTPVPIEEVESVDSIVKRFVTGAMSFGAISKEAHEAIALAMNTLGSRSNTGEGGEDSERYNTLVDGVSLSSKTKQVASGRFGVDTEYLVNAEEIQIKVAQGAKPGEGGQLPGFKVDKVIARTRGSIPGISLISPPPHHDIYSIEDLAELIFDLKNVNPKAAVSVKLVAESGVGTISAGVAKANADLIVISGAEGGTGASPASSMRFAGISPEIGLADAQQTLSLNGLRKQVRLQVDGQLKTGRDVAIMAALGADEFAFGTLPLIVLGCVMMRKCSNNTCPVGVATQDPVLRAKFRGRAQYLINYFRFLAQEVREYLSMMGLRSMDELIGRVDLLSVKPIDPSSKAATLQFARLLATPGLGQHWDGRQFSHISNTIDPQLITDAAPAVDSLREVHLEYSLKNTDRAVGAQLSGEVARKHNAKGLPDSTINVKFKGSAGQSFGAFLTRGINFRLEGETNDYFGKGLSGGRISILPPARATFVAADNVIAGNTGLYGATAGELYVNGHVGERFAVRNSGAIAVVEGAGDHCCEYMTGGRVVVLGPTGRNFAAGMSGGLAYVWNKDDNFDYFCNMDMVELSLIEESSCRKELHALVRQHWQHTGSPLARTMLDNWAVYIEQFIQVTPIEYKRVLEEEKMRKLQEKIAEIGRDY